MQYNVLTHFTPENDGLNKHRKNALHGRQQADYDYHGKCEDTEDLADYHTIQKAVAIA